MSNGNKAAMTGLPWLAMACLFLTFGARVSPSIGAVDLSFVATKSVLSPVRTLDRSGSFQGSP